MILFNTTFHIHSSVTDQALDWIQSRYCRKALDSKLFHSPLLLRILVDIDPEASSYAFQLSGTDLRQCQEWAETTGSQLFAELNSTFGQQVLPFHTFMESVER